MTLGYVVKNGEHFQSTKCAKMVEAHTKKLAAIIAIKAASEKY